MFDWIIDNPDNVTEADIIVGIPSRNEADTIAFPTEQASLGLTRYFPDKKAVIVNCDNFSTDGTKEAFFQAPCQVPRVYLSTPEGVLGKGNNFRNLFRLICDLKAEAVVVVDADLESITPRWIKNLGEPIFGDYGYVTPIYLRHKYDGTITNNIAYPMSRALYGRRVRQPIGGDFGFSGELAKFYLEHDSWSDATAHFGIDIWMTTLAMYFRKPITQAFLGRPKIHRAKDPASSLGPMFREVVGTLFNLQATLYDFWKDVHRSKPTAIFGFGLGESDEPPPVSVNTGALFSKLHDGYKKYSDLWREAMTEETFSKLEEVLAAEEKRFELPPVLWAHILFDMSVAYRDRLTDTDTLMESLAPLYFGRTLSFVKSTMEMGLGQAEEYIEEQCHCFEREKPYLLKRWG